MRIPQAGAQRVWYGRAAVRGRCHRLRSRVLVLLAGVLLVLAVPETGPAQAPDVSALRQRSLSLAAKSRAAVVELYGLDSRLSRVQADLSRIDALAADLARRQASVRRRYLAAQRMMTRAQL